MVKQQDAAVARRRGRIGKEYAEAFNGFAWLRLIGAVMVVFDHSAALIDPSVPSLLPAKLPLGDIAVLAFFAMSGYQISESWARDPNWWRFTGRRLLRLMPPLLVVLAFASLVIGPIFTTLSQSDYWANKGTWIYMLGVVPMLQEPKLPGVFDTNPHAWSVNPSLWTLPMELVGYGIVLLVGLLVLFKVSRMVVFVVLAGLMVQQGIYLATVGENGGGGWWMVIPLAFLVKFLVPFVLGMVLYMFRDKIPFRPLGAFIVLGVWALWHFFLTPETPPAQPGMEQAADVPLAPLLVDKYLIVIAASYGAIVLAHHWPKRLAPASRWVYGSYGMYIWGAPWQQVFVSLGVSSAWLLVACTLPIAYMFGLLSWNYIELPTQKLRGALKARQMPTKESIQAGKASASSGSG
jgi:peptidoglycan/LPS O-acetylase OafA/YrhL